EHASCIQIALRALDTRSFQRVPIGTGYVEVGGRPIAVIAGELRSGTGYHLALPAVAENGNGIHETGDRWIRRPGKEVLCISDAARASPTLESVRENAYSGLLVQGRVRVLHTADEHGHITHRLYALDGVLAQQKPLVSGAVVQLIVELREKAA